MTAAESHDGSQMLTGFNHNLRYRGKTYHVQTEDGGRDNPAIVTHTFLGGVIVDSVRKSYADIVGRDGWRDSLRDMMKAQHLEQIRRLFSGAFDAATESKAGDD
ncbi:MAG: hypothetical protein ACM3NF_12415 [Gemmatimonadota bacterium]